MPIIKKLAFNKTTILTNEFLQNKEISLTAKGLLGYMLSLPDNWDFTIKGIAEQTNESEYKITKTLQELESKGYHTKKHIYENGRIKDWIYYVFAEPRQDIIDKTFNNNAFEQELENQDVEKQECCFSYDKQIISNKLDIKQIKKETIINNIEKEQISKQDKLLKENIKCIIDYLNDSIGSKYKYNSKGTISLIKARFKEGYVLDDFYDVIDKKVKEWKGTEFEQYLRPSTLFGNKFENYLNQKTYFNGKPKSIYSSKSTFDNTAGHSQIYKISDEEFNKLTHKQKLIEMEKFSAIADMTKNQREFFNQHCLARDENGNLLKF